VTVKESAADGRLRLMKEAKKVCLSITTIIDIIKVVYKTKSCTFTRTHCTTIRAICQVKLGSSFMAFEKIIDLLAYREPRPNKFTIYLGNQIQKARLEAGLSQEELSNYIYKRRATVSDIENGKGEVDASTLALLAHILNKPLGYFYPPYLYQEIKQEDLSPLENELLIYFRQIVDETLQEAVIKQVKVFGDFDPKQLVLNLAPEIAARLENEDQLLEFLKKKKKQKR